MAKIVYRVVAPDGNILSSVRPDYVIHDRAVIGLMRLRKVLPKLNPDDDKEEPRYERFKGWVLIGTVAGEKAAESLIATQLYRGVTEETQVLPVAPIPFVSNRPATGRKKAPQGTQEAAGDAEDDEAGDDPGEDEAPEVKPQADVLDLDDM